MNGFQPDVHLNITVKHGLTQNLSQTIQAVQLLELNAEGLYEYLMEAAEANPMILVQRTPPAELPLHSRGEGFDPGELGSQNEQDLTAYLRRQLAFLKLPERTNRIAAYLAEALDDSGLFTEGCGRAAEDLGVSREEVEAALETVQSLDPPGIGAENLQQCLFLQLKRLHRRNLLAEILVGDHWELFLRKPRASALSDLLREPQDRVEEALTLIAGLNPRPANGFSRGEIRYVIPDAYITREQGEIHVQLMDSCTLTVDRSYARQFADAEDREVREFLRRCTHQADQLESRLRYRSALLQRILLAAAQKQAAYLAGGEKKPLGQKDIAALLGVNVSTVSRAIQGKYISLQGRCIPVRELFSRPSPGNAGRSSHSVRRQIAALIEGENPEHPLSDEQLHGLLKEKGVEVSRRLIAKYRGQAQIPPAYARKITR